MRKWEFGEEAAHKLLDNLIKSKSGRIAVDYGPPDTVAPLSARLFARSPCLQRIPSRLRPMALAVECVDFDIRNCHPVLAGEVYRVHGLPGELAKPFGLEEYNEDREGALDRMGLDKTGGVAVLNGRICDKDAHELTVRIAKDSKVLRYVAMQLRPEMLARAKQNLENDV